MDYKVHESAEVSEKARIGRGTKIWNHAQIREDSEIGVNCNIGKNVYIDYGVKIGDNVKIQNNSLIYQGVTLEDNVFIGPSVIFTNDLYPRAEIWDESRLVKTLVKKGASVCANVTILCGNTIGEYAMIGASSLVTKDIPDHALAYGNPAKVKGVVCKCGKKIKKGKTCSKCKK
ncbi:MAG: N-acetyltransferase [Candidatus Altiarchaeota archaeon]|nr:N-acetyltransferase [Candidatus Altiarchaeota archaeon]